MTDISNSKISAKITIALLCGGPSLERGISLNSARSVLDHLQSERVDIQPVYFNHKRQAYVLSPAQLYSNTPADFDFKLAQTTKPLTDEQLTRKLKTVNLVFPVIHGSFGEDGGIQKWLEERAIPYVGSSAAACKRAFDKYTANEFIKRQGFFTLPSCLLKIYKDDDNRRVTREFFAEHNIRRAIVKPAAGGSSIGVFSVDNAEEALEKAALIFGKRMDTRVVIEPFAEGREFTVIILQSRFGLPVAILPTEIETDYTEHQVFDFRKKYLPSRQVAYHCPPRFDDRIIERIQLQAEQLFMVLGMNDFARFDGWVLDDGSIWFSDFNPVSGMEQNSFLFQQAARIGLSHQALLEYVVARSCERQGIAHPFVVPAALDTPVEDRRQPLAVLMGGQTSERQVSLMSGTNVWLKLRNSLKYRPVPYLVDMDGSLWRVPYQLLLNHTVEEIIANCRAAALHESRVARFETTARERLGLAGEPDATEFGQPEHVALATVLEQYRRVFIALHGGMGEDGTLQTVLEERQIAFNGPGSRISRLAMDKQATAEAIAELDLPSLTSIQGVAYRPAELAAKAADNAEMLWHDLCAKAKSRSLIAKPVADGCSSGVVRLASAVDLVRYLGFIEQRASHIPPGCFSGQPERIELPAGLPRAIRFEAYLQTDSIRVADGKLRHTDKTGLVEVTIGVVERAGKMHALNPSITIADSVVLSVEEKFQGGTGVNLTPLPESIIQAAFRRRLQKNIEVLAGKLELRGYSRIDAFVDCKTGQAYVIEINSLPALTPSTVIFQQALAENPAIYPRDFLELIAGNKDQGQA